MGANGWRGPVIIIAAAMKLFQVTCKTQTFIEEQARETGDAGIM